jgi:hypothetical protein
MAMIRGNCGRCNAPYALDSEFNAFICKECNSFSLKSGGYYAFSGTLERRVENWTALKLGSKFKVNDTQYEIEGVQHFYLKNRHHFSLWQGRSSAGVSALLLESDYWYVPVSLKTKTVPNGSRSLQLGKKYTSGKKPGVVTGVFTITRWSAEGMLFFLESKCINAKVYLIQTESYDLEWWISSETPDTFSVLNGEIHYWDDLDFKEFNPYE